ncbi:TraM-binding TraD/TraG-like protein [Pseudonocardia sediminis]|uniref:TraM-binding TraD/TraG-like protein n=1 Tax=Pseudonocardia sediminis TaxID=1397368 RepID=A0A4Q7V1J9_PSEST|nr:type IV secretory system conjugative DNA transfer family protein [Pseudonocardia sediminis]RZT87334.1 TraM-binding TraD/TraG-like protein [Pseudonocardia sediminis]
MNLAALGFLAALVGAAVVAWRRRAWAIAVGCAVAALLPALTLWRTTHPLILTGAALVLAGVGWQRWGRSMATVTRWGARVRRKAGVASGIDIARCASPSAMRRRTRQVRPTLSAAATSRTGRVWRRVALPVAEVGVKLCRCGAQQVWATIEWVVIVVGGPRVGKTQWLAGRVLDAPGAALVTSTRTDLLMQTGPLRAQVGPVLVFNPVGLGGIRSTITFDPLTGCCDPVTANERAADMLGTDTDTDTEAGAEAGSGDRGWWEAQTRRNLAALLHAAALGGLTMLEVQDWVANLDRSQAEITNLLRNHSPEPGFVAAITAFIETNTRTRTSITQSIVPALEWLTHGPARAAARPISQGGRPFDVERLLEARATVYMLGGEEAQVAPLVAALTGHIARQARRIAVRRPGGRLDPPLSLRLDEAALICPVPLHRWTADMGGRGVSIVACFQSYAQIVERYGRHRAAVIMNNSGARLLFGGTADRDDLAYWSSLAGERDEPTVTTDMHGRLASRTTRRVPVLTPAQLATLPARRVVVFRADMAPVLGTVEQAYRRRDVRAYHQPGALTVRARRWARSGCHAAARWAVAVARPTARWARAGHRACSRWVRVAYRACTGRVAGLLGALRLRVTGVGPDTRTPRVVPGQVVATRPTHPMAGSTRGEPITQPIPVAPDDAGPRPRPDHHDHGPDGDGQAYDERDERPERPDQR